MCFTKSIIPNFSILFAAFSERENICTGAYSSFLLIPRHLTPTVYTSSATSASDILGFGRGSSDVSDGRLAEVVLAGFKAVSNGTGETEIAERRGDDGAGECARRGVADEEVDDDDPLPTL